jgi:pimeloyl-ACP methyl ester carboxylesterase
VRTLAACVVAAMIGSGLVAATSSAGPSERLAEGALPTLTGRCGSSAKGFRRVQLVTRDGARLTGAQKGTGRVGIVFAHQTDGTLCNWLPYARTLAKGHVVVAIDLRGYGQSTLPTDASASGRYDVDVATAVAQLRRDGAKRIVLIGASLGGTAVLAATRIVRPQVNGVVSLSGPIHFGDIDPASAVGALRIPVLLAAASGDMYARDARILARKAAANRRARLLVVPGFEHGWGLVGPGATDRKRVNAAILAVVAAANR